MRTRSILLLQALLAGCASSPGARSDCVPAGAAWEMPLQSVQRFRAYVDDDANLYALLPCHGWQRLGRFVGDHLETRFLAVLRRVPPEDRRALLSPLWDEVLVRRFFRCHPDRPRRVGAAAAV